MKTWLKVRQEIRDMAEWAGRVLQGQVMKDIDNKVNGRKGIYWTKEHGSKEQVAL